MSRDRRGLVGLLGALGVSMLGTRMTFLAVPWFVLATTGSPTDAGVVAAAELTPYVLVQALGGPFVDRHGAWRISISSDVVAAVLMGAIPLLHELSALPLGGLIVLVALAGSVRGAGDAARHVLVPGVGERAGIPMERAAGFYDGVNRGAMLIGAPLAGVLIGLTSAVNVLALDAASFLLSAAAIRTLVPRAAEPGRAAAEDDSATGQSYLSSLREGFAHLRADRLLLGIAAMVLVTNLLDQAGGAVLIPVWAKQVAHSAVALGLLSGVFSAGAVLGNLATTWLGPRLPRRWTYAVGFLLTGGPRFFALALAATVSPLLAVFFLSGLGAGGLNPILGAVEYERVPRHLQARVLGAVGATAWAGIPVGSLAGGALAEGLGVRGALALVGAIYLVTTLAPFVFPVWRQMDRRREPEPLAAAAAGQTVPAR